MRRLQALQADDPGRGPPVLEQIFQAGDGEERHGHERQAMTNSDTKSNKTVVADITLKGAQREVQKVVGKKRSAILEKARTKAIAMVQAKNFALQWSVHDMAIIHIRRHIVKRGPMCLHNTSR